MKKSKIKSFFTSRIFIGTVCFLLGGMFLGGSTGVNITQERYEQLLDMEKQVVPFTAGSNAASSEPTSNSDTSDSNSEKSTEEEKIAGLGDKVYISDSNGVKIMALTLNSAKLISERNQYSDTQVKKVVEIEYTYENIGSDETIYVSDSNFKIYDKSGYILSTYPAGANKYPQEISKGKKCTANMSFALNADSNELEVEFYENMFNSKSDATFKIEASNHI